MVKKLLVFILILFLFLAFKSESLAAKSFGATCAKADMSTGILISFDIEATYPFATNPANQKIYKSNDCGNNYVCRPFPGQGTICQEIPPPGTLADGAYCDANAECQSGYCIWAPNATNVHSCGYPPTTPTPRTGGTASSPNTTLRNLDCSMSSNKPGGCECTENPQCASSTCNIRSSTGRRNPSGTCNPVVTPTLTPCEINPNNQNCIKPSPTGSLTCDPVKDGVINTADYDLWLKEYTHQVNTTLTSCFVPGNNTVNILDFQVWKDISYGLKQSF